jgi:hypothetical protein
MKVYLVEESNGFNIFEPLAIKSTKEAGLKLLEETKFGGTVTEFEIDCKTYRELGALPHWHIEKE